MGVTKINSQSVNREFSLISVEDRFAAPPINVDDFKIRALLEDSQLQQMLKRANETIHEIRKISKSNYLIITSGGHEIPVEIRGIPYGRPHRFLNLDWNGGTFAMYVDMD